MEKREPSCTVGGNANGAATVENSMEVSLKSESESNHAWVLSCFSCVQLFATPWTTRLLCPWDSPGKKTRVGCHFYLFSSVAQSCPIICNPTDCSTPGFPVHHELLDLAQTHVHRVGDTIQLSHLLSSPSPPALSHSQHQGLFQWVSSLHQVAEVLEFQLQQQSFQRIFRTDFLWDGLAESPCRPRDSQESSPTPQFKSINSSTLSFLYSPTHIHTWLLGKPNLWLDGPLLAK